MALSELENIYDKLDCDISEYDFYGEGHHEVWVNTTRELTEKVILETCEYHQIGMPFSFNREACFSIHVDEERKAIYAVTNNANFDFTTKRHYEDWVHKDGDEKT
jgi:hypothetical protein